MREQWASLINSLDGFHCVQTSASGEAALVDLPPLRPDLVLNESSVWSGSPQNIDREGASAALPEIRRLLREGKNPEAEALVNRNFTCVKKTFPYADGMAVREIVCIWHFCNFHTL